MKRAQVPGERAAERSSGQVRPAARTSTGWYESLLSLQATAGNRASEQLVRRLAVQRGELSVGGEGSQAGTEALDTTAAPAGASFRDQVNATTTEVPVVVGNSALTSSTA